MVFISKTYSVYLHVFPNGKKYVGSTSAPLRVRWNGGLGYTNQKKMFSAIMNYGWCNIMHYLLFDGLTEKEAHLIEAALIRDWKTTMRGKGYNHVLPKVDGLDTYKVPEFKKTRIYDEWDESVEDRYAKRLKNSGWQSYNCKPILLIETGEVFESATAASRHMFVSPRSISRAATTPGATSGTCTIFIEERGIHMEIPAHWKYINNNTKEEKEG